MLNSDLHIHSYLSRDAHCPDMTAEFIVGEAERRGYDSICVTDHVWDANAGFGDIAEADDEIGAMPWYKSQPIERAREILPLPPSETVKTYFGIEAEYLGGERLGLTREGFETMDHVNIAISHFHLIGFTRPKEISTPKQLAALLAERLVQKLGLTPDREYKVKGRK